MKKLIYSYILVFAFCFMFFIYEPLFLYATNINDFWFDLGIMIKPVLIIFFLIFTLGSLVFTGIYFLNHKFSSKLKVYFSLFLVFAIAFLATYIEGNYLIANLPALDGSKITWGGGTLDNLITGIVWLVIIIGSIILVKKVKLEKTVKIFSYLSLGVTLMLTVSLVTTLVSNNAFASKNGVYVTDNNLNDISKNKNFLIFMLDAVDEDTFYKVWQENPEYKDLLNDFTYYNDAMSTYAFTRDSVPFVLSGMWNKNENEFGTYSSNAYNNSPFFKELTEKDYKMHIYEDSLVWNGTRNYEVENIKLAKTATVDLFVFFKQELHYDLFKYLPYFLKKYSRIEKMSFNNSINDFKSNDALAYKNMLKNKELNKIDSNLFQFYHIDGAHVPFNYDKNLNDIKDSSYEQEIEACLTLIKTYLNRLKENDSYDNSVIIIMADHGYDGNEIFTRFNPLLMIKGLNEKHDVIISKEPVSYVDLLGAYQSLLDGKKSTEILKNFGPNRKRTFIWYQYLHENHMVEYTTTKGARESSSFEATGNVFDR